MALYGYTRVSPSARSADERESLSVQRRTLQGWALMRGEELAEVFTDPDVSGSVPVRQRADGARMWSGLKRGDTVVAAKLDRMFRSALDTLQAVSDLQEMGVSLVLLDLGSEPVTNGLSKLLLTISAAFAEAERDKIRERVQTVKRDQRARGAYLGGKVPFGYALDAAGKALEPIPAELAALAHARTMRGAGEPLRAIQAHIEGAHGRKLSLSALHRLVAPTGG